MTLELITISWMVIALVYLLLSFYGFRSYLIDRMIRKETKVPLDTTRTILSASLGSLTLMLHAIARVLEFSGIFLFGENTATVNLIIGILGAAFIFHSSFTYTELAIKALTLAEHGITGTRKKWFIMFEKYIDVSMVIFLLVLAISSWLARTAYWYIFATIHFNCAFVYTCFAIKLISVSKDASQQNITQTIRRFYWVSMAFATGASLSMTIDLLAVALSIIEPAWAMMAILAIGAYMNFALIFFIKITSHQNKMQLRSEIISTPNASNNPDAVYVFQRTSLNIISEDGQVIGKAPPAPRPTWLPIGGMGQANVVAGKWSISLEHWIQFIRACTNTDTWKCLARAKGEKNINMYDMKTHFILPWTHGTGCSIACLMNENQESVELMISHAWTGSVKETLSTMESVLSLYCLPKETRIFFDSLCLYQPDDNAARGLSIAQQLAKKPFALIIQGMPKYGMFVVHTTISEVYERLWCVHEIDECLVAGVNIFGVFDLSSWDGHMLRESATNVKTCDADCQGKDKVMLTAQINTRGGFDRLDNEIKIVRRQSMKDLATAHLFQGLFGTHIASIRN